MANEKHLALLQQGVEMWNQWRENHPEIEPDLRGADLSGASLVSINLWKADLWGADLWGADLREADLSDANLWRVDLRGANLSHADLSGAYLWRADLRGTDLIGVNLMAANLSEADLWGANLTQANLCEANLWKADLRGVDLSRAMIDPQTRLDPKWKLVWQIVNQDVVGLDLAEADLREANLKKANLKKANLIEADLWGANLSEANLTGADLWGANLIEADLCGANLSEADLWRANLRGADLSSANLRKANLSEVNLCATQVLSTDFEGAILNAACIENWESNSETDLNLVLCDYVYLKDNQQERCPYDPDKIFAPGEFTKLFQPQIETVDLTFLEGINWQAFCITFQELRVNYGEDNFLIQALEIQANGTLSIRLKVSDDINKARMEQTVISLYQKKLQQFEMPDRDPLKIKDLEIERYCSESVNLLDIVQHLASCPLGSSYRECTPL